MPTIKKASKKNSPRVAVKGSSSKPAASQSKATATKSIAKSSSKAVKPVKNGAKKTAKVSPDKTETRQDVKIKRGAKTETDMNAVRATLMELRDRVTGQISFLSDDANHKDDSPTDDRTDEFDREFAFNLVSTEQEALYEIDEALRRIEHNSYGQCEICEGSIEKNRLQALPFARNCLQCQSDLEKGRLHGSRRWAVEDRSDQSQFDESEASESE